MLSNILNLSEGEQTFCTPYRSLVDRLARGGVRESELPGLVTRVSTINLYRSRGSFEKKVKKKKKKHPFLTNLGAFYGNLLKTHPQEYTQSCKLGTFVREENPQSINENSHNSTSIGRHTDVYKVNVRTHTHTHTHTHPHNHRSKERSVSSILNLGS